MGFMYLLSVLSCMLISISLSTGQYCYNTGNFTTNSTYGNNRNDLLSSLASNIHSNNLQYSRSIGEAPNEVFAHALCSGDFSSDKCASCINSTSQAIMSQCPNQKEAYMWSPACAVRYANRSISGNLELDPVRMFYNTGDIKSNMTEFDRIWENLMIQTLRNASLGSASGSFRFATEKANVTPSQTIYALMQCTPHLSQNECDICLRESAAAYQGCCHGKQGGGVERADCLFRWDLYPFFNETTQNGELQPLPDITPSPSLPPTSSTTTPDVKTRKREENRVWIAIVTPVSATIVVGLLGSLLWYLRRRVKKDKGNGFI